MWEGTIDIYLWFWSLQEKHCLRFLITPPTSPVTAVGVIGVADASQQHHYQHRSVASEIVSHTRSHAHKVCSNIREELITEDTSLMPTCQIGNTLKSGCVCCCCCWLFLSSSSACNRRCNQSWWSIADCQIFIRLLTATISLLEALWWDYWCLSICVLFLKALIVCFH